MRCRGLAHWLLDGRIIPCSKRRSKRLLAAASFSPMRRRGLAKTGGPVVTIWWLTAAVGPALGSMRGCARQLNSSSIALKRGSSASVSGSCGEATQTPWSAAGCLMPSVKHGVGVSTRRLSLRSTSSPKCARKSAPKVALLTSAMMNAQGKARRRPRFR